MSAMSQKQKDSRKQWRKRALYLIECTKLDHNNEEYMYVGDLIELLYDVPSYDMSDSDKKKYLGILGVKE